MPRVSSAKRHSDSRKVPQNNNFMVNESINQNPKNISKTENDNSLIYIKNNIQPNQQNQIKQQLYIDRLSMKQKLNETKKNNMLQKTEIQKIEKKILQLTKELHQTQKQSSAASAVKGYWEQQKSSEVIQPTDKITQIKEKIQIKKQELEYQESQLQQIQRKIKFTDIKETELSKKIKQQQCDDIKSQINQIQLRQEINYYIQSGQIQQIDDIFRGQIENILIVQEDLKIQNQHAQEENNHWKENIKEKKYEFININQEIRNSQEEVDKLEQIKKQAEKDIEQLEIQEQQREIKKKSAAILTNKDIQEESMKNQIRTLEEEIENKNAEIQKLSENNKLQMQSVITDIEKEQEIRNQLEAELEKIQNKNLDLEQCINNTPSLRSIVVQNKQIFQELKDTNSRYKFLNIHNNNRRHSASHSMNFNHYKQDSKKQIQPQNTNDVEEDAFELQRRRARSGDPRQIPQSERQQIIEKNEDLEESPMKSRKLIEDRKSKKEDFKKRIQEFKQSQQSFNKLQENSIKITSQKKISTISIPKERLDQGLQHINDEKLKEIQINLMKIDNFQKMLFQAEEIFKNYLEVQNCRIYIIENNNIIRYDKKSEDYFQKVDFNKEAGIFGQAIMHQNLIMVNQTHNDSYYNPIVDINTQLPLITYPIYVINKKTQASDMIGAIQCINPAGVGNIYSSQKISQNLMQKFNNIGDIIANQIYYFQQQDKEK